MGWLVGVSVVCAGLGPASAQSNTRSEAEARERFAAGLRAYDAAEFDVAVREFRRAYLLSPRFELLYNIGQAELRAGNDALALEAFEGFLRQAPDDHPLHGEVAERVRVLRGLGVEPAREGGPSEAAARPAGGGVDPAPWIVLGIGAAVIASGAVLMGVGFSEGERVTNTPDGASWAEVQSIAASADAMWAAGIALLGVGAAAAVTGLVWALAGSPSRTAANARLRLGPTSLSLEGAF